MSASLYLIETRAQRDYRCAGCEAHIRKGSRHFRHDPFPAGWLHRGMRTSHWCHRCITASGGQIDSITHRIRTPVISIKSSPQGMAEENSSEQMELALFKPLQVRCLDVSSRLLQSLVENPSLLHSLDPSTFEDFVCERLYAMGMEPRKTGNTNRKDGGIDIVFWPREKPSFPFLGAVQAKHHSNPRKRESAGTVRDFSGAIAGTAFAAGLIVTNTDFSADALWFARERAKLIRLRGFVDIQRWLLNNFDDEMEWREIPKTIELSPGIVVNLR